jgi:hypothetical protein
MTRAVDASTHVVSPESILGGAVCSGAGSVSAASTSCMGPPHILAKGPDNMKANNRKQSTNANRFIISSSNFGK